MNSGQRIEGTSLLVLSLGARLPSIPGPHWGVQKRIGPMPCRAYKGGVCPSEVVKVESGARADSDPPGGLSFLERKSVAYLSGFDSGRSGRNIGSCPYEGHNDASLEMQRLWMAGNFDAVTGAWRTRRIRPRHITKRKSVRVRWPRSQYARRRLEAIIVNQHRKSQ